MDKVLFLLIAALMFSCGDNNDPKENTQSVDSTEIVEKFNPSELEIISDGLSCDDTYFSAGNRRSTSVYYQYGEKVNIHFINLKGFKEENGLIFPKMDAFIIDKKGDTISSGFDLDIGIDNGYKTETGGIDLNTYTYLDAPILPHENYRWDVYISDRNSEKKLQTTCILGISRNEKLSISTTNATCVEGYLYDVGEGMVIKDNRVFPGQTFKVYFDGIEGLVDKDGKMFPGMEMSLKNGDGDLILYAENALSYYQESGIDSEIVSKSIYGLVEVPEDEKGPMLLGIRIFDLNGDAEVECEIELELIEFG